MTHEIKSGMLMKDTVIYQPHRLQQSDCAPTLGTGVEYLSATQLVGDEAVSGQMDSVVLHPSISQPSTDPWCQQFD